MSTIRELALDFGCDVALWPQPAQDSAVLAVLRDSDLQDRLVEILDREVDAEAFMERMEEPNAVIRYASVGQFVCQKLTAICLRMAEHEVDADYEDWKAEGHAVPDEDPAIDPDDFRRDQVQPVADLTRKQA